MLVCACPCSSWAARCAWGLLGGATRLEWHEHALGCGSSVQGGRMLFRHSRGFAGRRSHGDIWVCTQCLLAGGETALHLTAAPYRELPWAWVSVCVCGWLVCVCGWLCARVCGAAQSVLFGCARRCCCGLVRCGQSRGSFNAGAGAAV